MPAAFEVFAVFLRLGLTSFGGPVAHLAYFRDAFVTRRKWIDEAGYADLVALCQFLPGPASSQVGFALGLRRAGLLGGLAAWTGFTAPSALLMLAAAYGVSAVSGAMGAAIIHGLKLVAVAVVAHAVVGMARSLLTSAMTWTLALLTALCLLALQSSFFAPVLILIAGAIGTIRWKRPANDWEAPDSHAMLQKTRIWLLLCFALAAVAVFSLTATDANDNPLLQLGAVMTRTGALVFGGGHAVLPLLEADVVGRGWMSEDTFLAGYGAAQALPGPLFSFAAFVGAASGQGIGGALVALVAIFLPGLALVALALPWWEKLKRHPRAIGFVGGANAAVVGVLAAAFYDPVLTSAVKAPADLAVAAAGFVGLQWLKAPAWLVVILVGGAGALLAA